MIRCLRFAIRTVLCTPFLFLSCTSLPIYDVLPSEEPRGYVAFHTVNGQPGNPGIDLLISQFLDGKSESEAPHIRFMQGPVRFACPPGENEFVVSHQNWQQRLVINVMQDAVTWAGVRGIVTDVKTVSGYNTPGSTTTTYTLQSSVGSHPLPLRADPAELNRYLAAMTDDDWATRYAAVRALLEMDVSFDTEAVKILTKVAGEDPITLIRHWARELLSDRKLPVPQEPRYIESWEESGPWVVGTTDTYSFGFVSSGYEARIEGKDDARWAFVRAPEPVWQKRNLDAVIELRWTGGSDIGGFGLLLGQSSNDFYAYCISGNSGAAVLNYTDGGFAGFAIPWTMDAESAIDHAGFSRIEVQLRGEKISMKVNDIPIGEFQDTRNLLLEQIGVYIYGAQVVFHKIVITSP